MKKVLLFLRGLPKSIADLINTNRNSFVLITICSVLLNFILEAALRKSFPQSFALIYKAPVAFLFNTLIIISCYSIMYFVKRRPFIFALNTILWLTVAAVSRCLMGFRTTPFNASDFRVIKSALTIIPVYLEIWQIIGIALLVILAISFLVYIFIKAPKSEKSVKYSAIIAAIICTFTASCTAIYLGFAFDTDHFSNLPTAYKQHGFNICFLCSIFDHGIDKPQGYSANTVDNIVEELEINLDEIIPTPTIHPGDITTDTPTNELPNIIFLQLESFYDVNNIEGYTYSENPIPIYTNLKNNFPGGLLTVPSIGAGTCNTEFEVITGMEVSYFGVAEYPYLSVLQNNTCESIAYNTKHLGYTAHAIHNHKGTFYDRNKVFPNLGFETFTSLENMPDIQKNKRNWARDSMLTNNILLALESTPEGRDLVYTISVQPHGRYPGSWASYEKLLDGEAPHITFTGNDNNPENAGFCYYINELHEADAFIGSLLSEIISRGEPTVVVMFGDHLPAFTVQNWTVKEGDYYTTDYIVWNNCGIDFSDAPEKLTSYQLSSFIFKTLGFTEGSMNKLNQKYIGTDIDYSHERQMLEYDMLYGDRAALDNIEAYVPVNTTYGLAKISITSMISIEGRTYVKGENFNQNSTVTVNGKLKDTEFIDKQTLCFDSVPRDGDLVSVVQLAANHTVLGGSDNEIIFTDDMIIQSEDTSSSQETTATINPQLAPSSSATLENNSTSAQE